MKNNFKIGLERVTLETGPNDVYLLHVNGEVVFSGKRQDCVQQAYKLGCAPKSLRYTDAAKAVIVEPRYRRMVARKAAGKQLTKYDENFLERYGKHFT
jgi:hypothetical protein